jgi:hypothetical protein
MKLPKTTGIITSTHANTGRENIGDILSAVAISKLFINKTRLYILPRDIGASANLPVIYGGGGMIRPRFSLREVYRDFLLRKEGYGYEIYGVGLNCDLLDPQFSRDDLVSLRDWVCHANKTTVRDIATKNFIEHRLKLKCQVAPCPAYQILRHSFSHTYKDALYKVGIVASFGHTATSKKFLHQTTKLIKDILMKVGPRQVSIICHDMNDYRFAKKNFNNHINISRPQNFKEINSAYQICESILTFRGHGVIFAAATNKPCSPIVFSSKLKSLYEYHYQNQPIQLTFSAQAHLNYLSASTPPRIFN